MIGNNCKIPTEDNNKQLIIRLSFRYLCGSCTVTFKNEAGLISFRDWESQTCLQYLQIK